MTKREFDWVVSFGDGVAICIGCLWRLLDKDRIRLTSADHGHQFGLPTPLDCVSRVNSLLAGAVISDVELHNGTLDLFIRFDSGCVLELLADSSGYEAWQISRGLQDFIAVGGGRLDVFDRERRDPTRESLKDGM